MEVAPMIRPLPVQILSLDEHRALARMALDEYRSPADQAAFLVREGLRRSGYLQASVPACETSTLGEDQAPSRPCTEVPA
jgi:hypothetical protein